MAIPFLKGQKLREQKREEKRIVARVKDELLPLLLAECENVNDLKVRVEAVSHATEANLNQRVIDFKQELKAKRFGDLGVVALPGKGEKLEQKIIELFKDEPLKVMDEILSRFPAVIDACIHKEMLTRKPGSLLIEL